jgi:hypothetical protein
MRKTRVNFERKLNRESPKIGSTRWNIGGIVRSYHEIREMYGSAMRRYDPTQFDVMYNEWVKYS